ncbi:MAG TPA: hypothetical protein VKP88_08070 [Candidatus Paceibacterota bacterium]|nr:hypothetical protein [Candidatus Paceibacterota bacterium]
MRNVLQEIILMCAKALAGEDECETDVLRNVADGEDLRRLQYRNALLVSHIKQLLKENEKLKEQIARYKQYLADQE